MFLFQDHVKVSPERIVDQLSSKQSMCLAARTRICLPYPCRESRDFQASSNFAVVGPSTCLESVVGRRVYIRPYRQSDVFTVRSVPAPLESQPKNPCRASRSASLHAAETTCFCSANPPLPEGKEDQTAQHNFAAACTLLSGVTEPTL